jgi:hypothetical protein
VIGTKVSQEAAKKEDVLEAIGQDDDLVINDVALLHRVNEWLPKAILN